MKLGLSILLIISLASLASAQQVATPTFSIVRYWSRSRIDLNTYCSTPDAIVYYTTDGNDPTETSPIATPKPYYAANVIIDRRCTLKARAFKPGMQPSGILSAPFPYIYLDTPRIIPASGQYSEPQKVVVHSTTGSTIYYTLDGTEPGPGCDSIPSGSTVLVDHPLTLKVRAYKQDCPPSSVTSASYTFREPVILHVRTDGDDGNDGLTWGSAKRTIQSAVDVAVGGDEIWVAAGTYRGAYLKHGIRLYGGFTGVETSLGERDLSRNKTIVDGGGYYYPMLVIRNATSATVIDGFVLERSAAYGAIDCSFASPTIVNNVIKPIHYAGVLMAGFPDRFLVANNIIVGSRDSTAIHLRCLSQGNWAIPISTTDNAGLITNNTLIDNAGSGIYANLVGVVAANNVIAFNRQGTNQQDGQIDLRNNCVFGNTVADYLSFRPEEVPHPTDINVDPLFRDMANGDCRLRWDSPCIDAGTNDGVPSTDIEGSIRPMDGNHDGLAVVDIGAYEAPMPVQIDVLADTVRLQPNKLVQVAILSDAVFNALNVGPKTVIFGPGNATEIHGQGHPEDVNADGLTDLLFHFSCTEVGVVPGYQTLILTGKLVTGEDIIGSDGVTGIVK